MTSTDQNPSADRDLKLQFARQLYQACMERHGKDHDQTRLGLSYVHSLELGDADPGQVTDFREGIVD